MVGFHAEKALLTIGFWSVGFALVGVAGLLFAMSSQKDDLDEDEAGDKLEEGWVDEVMSSVNNPDKPNSIGNENDALDGEETEEPDGFQESPSETTEQDADQEDEQDADETDRIVYATVNGKVWHADRECPQLRRAKTIRELTMSEAETTDMKACRTCGK